MKHRFKIALTAAILVTIVAGKTGVSAAMRLYPSLAASDTGVSSHEIIKLTNDYRASQGLPILQENARLDQAAADRARDMLHRGYFDHTAPDGNRFSKWVQNVNYKYFYVGENLAIDFNDAGEAFHAWLGSPEHLENIIRPQYHEIGVAAIEGNFNGRPTTVIVQIFGSRVMGAYETAAITANHGENNMAGSTDSLENNSATWWQQTFSLKSLERLDLALNYLLALALIILFFSYRIRKMNQPNMKTPMARRYQANALSE